MPKVVVPFPTLSAAALAPDSRRRLAGVRLAEGLLASWRAWVLRVCPGAWVRENARGWVCTIDAGLDPSTRLAIQLVARVPDHPYPSYLTTRCGANSYCRHSCVWQRALFMVVLHR